MRLIQIDKILFEIIFGMYIRADGGLAPTEGGNEDGIVGGPRTPQQIAAQRRLQQTQAQVDEVIFSKVYKQSQRKKSFNYCIFFFFVCSELIGRRYYENECRKSTRTRSETFRTR